MHSAKLERSKRLQRTLEVLRQGKATTRQIIRKAHVCAVSSVIAELRANGIGIECKKLKQNIFEYSLTTEVDLGLQNADCGLNSKLVVSEAEPSKSQIQTGLML